MFEIIGMFTVIFIVIYTALGPLFKVKPKVLPLRIEDVSIRHDVYASYASGDVATVFVKGEIR